jgi:hypothetical protein
MALNSVWYYWASTGADSGSNSNSITIYMPPLSLFGVAALNEFYTNSAGGSAQASIESYQTRDPNTGIDSAPIQVNGPVFSDNNVVSITFQISVNAQSAGAFFGSGVNANGTFLVEAWDG